MIYKSFVEIIRFNKFKRNILTPPPPPSPTLSLLKSRFVLFLPIADKYIEFYQTGKLRVNQTFTILPSFLQSRNIKKTKFKQGKPLALSLCD